MTLVEDFTNLNKFPENSCQLASREPFKDKHLKIMSDVIFTAAGSAIMIEDDHNQKLQSKRETYAPKAFGSITFNPTLTKLSIITKHSFPYTLFLLNLDTSCREAPSQSSCSPTTDQEHALFEKNSFLQHSGMHAIVACSTILSMPMSPVQ